MSCFDILTSTSADYFENGKCLLRKFAIQNVWVIHSDSFYQSVYRGVMLLCWIIHNDSAPIPIWMFHCTPLQYKDTSNCPEKKKKISHLNKPISAIYLYYDRTLLLFSRPKRVKDTSALREMFQHYSLVRSLSTNAR